MMTDADVMLLAEKMAKVAPPQSGTEWSILGAFLVFLLLCIAGLAFGGRSLLQKLLEAKEDMRGLIVKLTEVVAANTHVMQETTKVTQDSAKVVEALRQEVHTAGVLREIRSSPAARGVQS